MQAALANRNDSSAFLPSNHVLLEARGTSNASSMSPQSLDLLSFWLLFSFTVFTSHCLALCFTRIKPSPRYFPLSLPPGTPMADQPADTRKAAEAEPGLFIFSERAPVAHIPPETPTETKTTTDAPPASNPQPAPPSDPKAEPEAAPKPAPEPAKEPGIRLLSFKRSHLEANRMIIRRSPRREPARRAARRYYLRRHANRRRYRAD